MSYPRLYFVLVIFYILISSLLSYIRFLGLLCITGEYGGFQKLCGDVKKKNCNVATFGQQNLKPKSSSTS